MFQSFFPNPKLFFLSFVLWALACVLGWYFIVQDFGASLSLGSLFGIYFPEALAEGADADAQAAFQSAQKTALNIWLYQYMILCYLIFVSAWIAYGGQKWAKWSVLGSALIVFITWFQVQVSVMLNEWYGTF
ncbi:MAG: peptide/bleomycin uptake transporter, partial [Marinomonas primoryensis]